MAEDGVMPQKKWPPIDIGTQVATTEKKTPDVEWNFPEDRKWGVRGTIIAYHDSHGLCYEVRHKDGSVGAYDPSEFAVVE